MTTHLGAAAESGAAVGAAAHIIKRPRLTRILDETEARIILLCAPAGYGKTTLAREWVATRSEPVLWYSGGPAMADVAALAVDLAELFGGADSELAERVRFLASRGEGPRTLAKALAAGAPGQETILVIDDYHYAGQAAEPDSLTCELVRRAQFRVLLATRIRPQWIDGRSRVYGLAKLLDQGWLAFTREEASTVLPDGLSVIENAHGWPAVIGLAAVNGVPALREKSIAPEELYEFVAADLFSGTDERLRMSLMVLAAGGDTTRAVARAALGPSYESDVQAATDRGFVVRDTQGWVAIHPLLRRFLMHRLEELDRPSQQRAFSRVLAALRADAQWDACLRLLEHFPDEDASSLALEEALGDLLATGRTATVSRWVDLALEHRFNRPIFQLAAAEVSLRKGRGTEASALARQAANRMAGDVAARAYLAAARAAHQADDAERSSEDAMRAEKLAVSPELKTEALALQIASAYERQPELTEKLYERLRAVDDPRPEYTLRLSCAETQLHIEHGNAREALAAVAPAVALCSRISDPLLRTNVLNLHAHLLRVYGEYELAVATADKLLQEAAQSDLAFVVEHGLLVKAAAFVGMRRIADARRVLRVLTAETEDTTQHVRVNAAMTNARLKITIGDLDGAAIVLGDSAPAHPPALRAEFLALRGLIEAADGKVAAARRTVAAASVASRSEEARAYAALAEATVLLAGGQDSEVVLKVAGALRAGNRDSVVVACRAVPRLAQVAAQHGLGAELEALFSRSRDKDLGRRAGLAMPRERRVASTLSPREIDVYELLVAGRTNREIAATLFISQSTAKVHIRHIYEKLGVHSRAEAAALKAKLD